MIRNDEILPSLVGQTQVKQILLAIQLEKDELLDIVRQSVETSILVEEWHVEQICPQGGKNTEMPRGAVEPRIERGRLGVVVMWALHTSHPLDLLYDSDFDACRSHDQPEAVQSRVQRHLVDPF
jgi:hypothetical protein